jgi:hypothetical protein
MKIAVVAKLIFKKIHCLHCFELQSSSIINHLLTLRSALMKAQHISCSLSSVVKVSSNIQLSIQHASVMNLGQHQSATRQWTSLLQFADNNAEENTDG